MKTTNAKKSNVLIVVGVIATFLILYYYYWNKDAELKRNKSVAIGLITEIKTFQGGNTAFAYEYYVNGQRFVSTTSFGGLCLSLISRLDGYRLPVIYDTDNPRNVRLLITKKSFERFNVTIPDSLQWIDKACK